jgi:hypothetical protein
VNLTLVNAEAEGLVISDFQWGELKQGDSVRVLTPQPGSEGKRLVPIWVRVTKVVRHPHPDYNIVTGIVDEIKSIGEVGVEAGATISFGRCNIAEIA